MNKDKSGYPQPNHPQPLQDALPLEPMDDEEMFYQKFLEQEEYYVHNKNPTWDDEGSGTS